MCPPSVVLFVLLLIASFSKPQENSTNDDEQSDNSTVQSDNLISSMKYQNDEMEPTRCNSMKNDDETQYESCINSTKNDRKNDDSVQQKSREHIVKSHEENNEMSMQESRENSTEINVSTLQEINKILMKTINESNIINYEQCNNITCLNLCCPLGDKLTAQGICVTGHGNYSFPSFYQHGNNSEDKNIDIFLIVRDPCVLQGFGRRHLSANQYLFLTNGSLYQGPDSDLILPESYCLAILLRDIYDVIMCTRQTKLPQYVTVCLLLSLPGLLLTFVIYSVLPELQNMHGYTLRAHVASLFVTYTIMYTVGQITGLAATSYCIPLAYIFNFFFLASFFWLNVTCFDIWWTFRELRSPRVNLKQEKKKFVIYSLYAWGITLILNIACAIIDNVSGIPESFVRPEICRKKFWYGEDYAKTIYFYIPMCATIVSNIFFFIATTLTILYQNKDTAHQLKDSESKRHNENKQRLNMYLKLSIVMGIPWILEILAWWVDSNIVPAFVWYPADMINALQGLIIFIIFVCRKKIKQQLLKQYGGRNCGPFKIPTNRSTTSTTTTTSTGSGIIAMQEISPSSNHHQ